jgi:regulator of CtrA degradation
MGKDQNRKKSPEVAVIWSAEFDDAVKDFAGSKMFGRLFEDGMSMVESTATYLDGEGRQEAKGLPRSQALAYAGESMRLTTRLMQVASWLLVQKAIKEGEMTPEEAAQAKYRVSAQEICRGPLMDNTESLPAKLMNLLERSEYLYDRIDRLDRSMYREPKGRQASTLTAQINRLKQVFGEHRL